MDNLEFQKFISEVIEEAIFNATALNDDFAHYVDLIKRNSDNSIEVLADDGLRSIKIELTEL